MVIDRKSGMEKPTILSYSTTYSTSCKSISMNRPDCLAEQGIFFMNWPFMEYVRMFALSTITMQKKGELMMYDALIGMPTLNDLINLKHIYGSSEHK